MPISASAKKSLASATKKRSFNVRTKLALKSALKNINKENVADVVSRIDKATKLHIIHPNKAARLKARIGKQFEGMAFAKKSTSTPSQTKAKKAAPAKPKTAAKTVTKKSTEKSKTESKAKPKTATKSTKSTTKKS